MALKPVQLRGPASSAGQWSFSDGKHGANAIRHYEITASLPNYRHAIGRELRIARDQRESVSLRLSDEQPVERIAVVQREPKEFVKVPRVDGLDSEPEADESAGK